MKSNHSYTELAKTAVSNTELYNLYGIVVDATAPHKKDDIGYKTHIKIVDPSLQGSGKDGSISGLNVTFLSKIPESLPSIKNIGEIIRVHRCNIGSYKNVRTFLVNMGFGSSWVIFEGLPYSNTINAVNDDNEENVELSSGDLISEDEEEIRNKKK